MSGQLHFRFEMYAINHNFTSVPTVKPVKPNMFFLSLWVHLKHISQSGQPWRIFVIWIIREDEIQESNPVGIGKVQPCGMHFVLNVYWELLIEFVTK